jgi:hypothetical protein
MIYVLMILAVLSTGEFEQTDVETYNSLTECNQAAVVWQKAAERSGVVVVCDIRRNPKQ